MDDSVTITIEPALGFLGILNLLGAAQGLPHFGSVELEGWQQDRQSPSCGDDSNDLNHCEWSSTALV